MAVLFILSLVLGAFGRLVDDGEAEQAEQPAAEHQQQAEPENLTPAVVDEPPAEAESRSRDPFEVSRAAWVDGEWPYTVDRGRIECREPSAVFFRTEDGRLWAINGFASAHAKRYGAEPSTRPIWRVDEAGIKQYLEMGISREAIGDLRIHDSVLGYGLEVCGF